MKLKPIITWTIVLFIVFYLVTQPAAAGHVVHNLLNGVKSAFNSIATFLNSI
jgi:hypothetical protein